MHRLRAQLARFEDAFPGFRTEIVEGSVVARPVRPCDGRTVRLLWAILEPQLPEGWEVVSGVLFPFDDAHELCPDLAVLPAEAVAENRVAYRADLIELVIEVVSPESARGDYEVKDRQYASRGIPDYLVFDPRQGHVVTLRDPGPGGYRGRDVLPYGGEVTVEAGIGRLTVATSCLPLSPQSPGGGRRTPLPPPPGGPGGGPAS
ncbi:Uma2 family endonuclease [Streptomyces sp. NPDC029554]|uniref:Uma2 family endonuclease n=1 Tax=Streptomyces sp. NPDC029554 TaxID=3155126 RepID=UPI003408117A